MLRFFMNGPIRLPVFSALRRPCSPAKNSLKRFGLGLSLTLGLSLSCATSSQPPKQASPELLSRLAKERDALKKEVRALKSKTSSSRKSVKRLLAQLMYPKTGIGALNADPKKVVVRWQTIHSNTRLKGSLRTSAVNESGAPAAIILKKGKK